MDAKLLVFLILLYIFALSECKPKGLVDSLLGGRGDDNDEGERGRTRDRSPARGGSERGEEGERGRGGRRNKKRGMFVA